MKHAIRTHFALVISLLGTWSACQSDSQEASQNSPNASENGQENNPNGGTELVSGLTDARVFQPYELTFDSAINYDTGDIDPFNYLSNRFYVELYEPGSSSPIRWGNGDIKKFFGFWDGGRTWKVRINFWRPGTWRFVSKNTMGDTSLSGIRGEVSVGPALEMHDLSKHGYPLKFDAKSRHLTYADGTPFFWLADTWWSFPKGFSSAFLTHASNVRISQGFSVIQTHGFHIEIDGVSGLSAAKRGTSGGLDYWRLMDDKIAGLNRAGLAVFLGYGSYNYIHT